MEQRLGDAVQLVAAALRWEPRRGGAVADESDRVSTPKMSLGERQGGGGGAVEHVRRRPVRRREGVEEEEDVGVALGVVLVDVDRPATRRRRPVAAADAVTALELAAVGELDAVAVRA